MIFTFTFNDFHDLIELEMISHEKKKLTFQTKKNIRISGGFI